MTQRQHHHRRTLSRRAKAKRQAPERIRISPSEPEAVLGKDKTKVFRPLYNIQLACDLDSDLILGSGVFAASTDANPFVPLMERVAAQCGTMPQVALNDQQYANILNLKFCGEHQITMYATVSQAPLPVPTSPAGAAPGPAQSPGVAETPPGQPPRMIPKAALTWLPEQQTYRCPAGHLLVLQRQDTKPRAEGDLSVAQYRCPAAHCQGCPLRDRCTRSPHRGRTIKRSEHDDLYEALRQRMGQAEGQAVYKLRKQTVERQFADLKQHRGLRCFRSFGLERARIQVGLLVLAHNVLGLLKARSQRRGEATASLSAGDGETVRRARNLIENLQFAAKAGRSRQGAGWALAGDRPGLGRFTVARSLFRPGAGPKPATSSARCWRPDPNPEASWLPSRAFLQAGQVAVGSNKKAPSRPTGRDRAENRGDDRPDGPARR
jgi:hypothetical protein